MVRGVRCDARRSCGVNEKSALVSSTAAAGLGVLITPFFICGRDVGSRVRRAEAKYALRHLDDRPLGTLIGSVVGLTVYAGFGDWFSWMSLAFTTGTTVT